MTEQQLAEMDTDEQQQQKMDIEQQPVHPETNIKQPTSQIGPDETVVMMVWLRGGANFGYMMPAGDAAILMRRLDRHKSGEEVVAGYIQFIAGGKPTMVEPDEVAAITLGDVPKPQNEMGSS